jgi:hypothetical protein
VWWLWGRNPERSSSTDDIFVWKGGVGGILQRTARVYKRDRNELVTLWIVIKFRSVAISISSISPSAISTTLSGISTTVVLYHIVWTVYSIVWQEKNQKVKTKSHLSKSRALCERFQCRKPQGRKLSVEDKNQKGKTDTCFHKGKIKATTKHIISSSRLILIEDRW